MRDKERIMDIVEDGYICSRCFLNLLDIPSEPGPRLCDRCLKGGSQDTEMRRWMEKNNPDPKKGAI